MDNSGRKKIGIYGGAFDPPHIGHRFAIEVALNSRKVDEIIVVPSGSRSDKKYHAADRHRLKMTELMLREYFSSCPVKLSDIEIQHADIRGTVELINALKTERDNKEIEFYFICGDELISQIPYWRNQKELKLINFLIISRSENNDFNGIPGFNIDFIKNEKKILGSSTDIRKRLKKGTSVLSEVGSSVYDYIKIHKVY